MALYFDAFRFTPARFNRSPRGDVVSAVHEQLSFLVASVYPKRAEALRFIIHFVGDAHQPFHAGDHEDGGGNGIAVTWQGYPTNLHAVWDTRMVKSLNLSVTELADQLDTPDPTITQKTPEDWVTESSHLAAGVYPSGETELSTDYATKHLPIVKSRLREGALRLAYLLNSAFGCP